MPAATIVTCPALVIVATLVLEDDQVTLLLVALVGETVQVNLNEASPTFFVIVSLPLMVTPVTFTTGGIWEVDEADVGVGVELVGVGVELVGVGVLLVGVLLVGVGVELVGVGVLLVGVGVLLVGVVVPLVEVGSLLGVVDEVGSIVEVGVTLVVSSLDERRFFLDGVGAHPARISAAKGIRIDDFLICIS